MDVLGMSPVIPLRGEGQRNFTTGVVQQRPLFRTWNWLESLPPPLPGVIQNECRVACIWV